MKQALKITLEKEFNLTLNNNQFQDIKRLIFEIKKREVIPLKKLLRCLKKHSGYNRCSGKNKFFSIKKYLIKRRFPLTVARNKIDTKKIFLPKTRKALLKNWHASATFKPLKILVEPGVQKSFLVDNFRNKFPRVNIEIIDSYRDYLNKYKFNISNLKKPLIFIVERKSGFIKKCPCTKYHLHCGYWIFNLGFGCPFDCSYCFLQQYSNFPGIILPANIDAFFEEFNEMHKTLKKPIRIGTGEFCDSLALDHITEYSKKLIPFFKNKNVLFELKTKSDNIANILTIKPAPNIIISWSLSTPDIIKSEEKATASLTNRLKAAKALQHFGYNIGFHFDPIVYSKKWDIKYKKLIDRLYSYVIPPFAWISIGTLRSNHGLEIISQQRFPQSNIFYGELFIDKDNKLRYPDFLRQEIYNKVTKYIRAYDKHTNIYLCMENKKIWEGTKGLVPSANIDIALRKI